MCYPSQVLSSYSHFCLFSPHLQYFSMINRAYDGIFTYSGQPVTEGKVVWHHFLVEMQKVICSQLWKNYQMGFEAELNLSLAPREHHAIKGLPTFVENLFSLWVIQINIFLGGFYFTIPSNTCQCSLSLLFIRTSIICISINHHPVLWLIG